MSEPSKPADSGNKPMDLKSRLGLKTQAATKPAEVAPPASNAGAALPPPPQPVLPPPPVQKPKVEMPTAESIAEARSRAAALSADAGPAIEEFSIGGAPEKTPVPSVGVGGVRVEYIDAGPAEVSPEVKKKQRFVLIGAVVAAALIAFFLGQALSSAGALSALKENMVVEAQDKLRFIEANQPVFDKIAALAKELKDFNKEAAAVAAGQKPALELEAPMATLIGKVKTFVDDKTFLDPAVVMGRSVYNGDLMAQVLNFALRTQIGYQQAQAMLEEALALVAMWRPVVGDARSVRIFSDVEELDHPDGGKMPRGKGTIVTKLGPPTKVAIAGADGREAGQEFQQMVMLVGQTDAIQVKTTQVTWTDLGPFFDDQLNNMKTVSIGRLTVLTERLEKALDGCKAEPVKQMISEALAKMGAAVEPAAAKPAAEPAEPAEPVEPEPAKPVEPEPAKPVEPAAQ